MSVCWFGKNVRDQVVPVTYYFGVKECCRLARPLGGELDCWMEKVYFVAKHVQVLLAVQPGGKYVVYVHVPPPDAWVLCGLSW